ncbi:MAG TPA: hypothetical protein VN735_02875 [Steroidobacteraceae bacterium]|nr:hypothetical protein [Steroidobacteraceae bacterium]
MRIAPVRAGVPSPWSELCRACFHVKRVPFALINARDPKLGLGAIKALTAQEALPVVFWNGERPRSNWLEQILLAERIAPEPSLLPIGPRERALAVGLTSELCSERGFGWHRRVLMIEILLTHPRYGDRERSIGKYLAAKYRHDDDTVEASRRRCEEIVATFVELRNSSGEFLLGSTLSVLDLAWAAFAALIRPLSEELCPMAAPWRDLYTWMPAESEPEGIEALLGHRDRIYRDWLRLPVVLD